MRPVPRSVLLVVVVILGGLALFGLVSGITTALGRSGPPATAGPASAAAGAVEEAKPLNTLIPPPPVPEPEADKAEEEEEAEKEEAAQDKKASADALPKAPEPYTPPPVLEPAPAPGPESPPPPPVEGAAGPALY